MMKTLSIFAIAFVSIGVLAPSAAAMSQSEVRACNALAASFKPQKSAFDSKTLERDALAVAAEQAGETWENAENVRTLSPQNNAEAEEARIAYDNARAEFETAQSEWQTLGTKLNDDFAAFNNKCVQD